MKRLFAFDPSMRSSAKKYDPCIVGDGRKCKILCGDCQVFLIGDRFLGEEFHREVLGRTYKRSHQMYPFVIITDAVGCDLNCWFCYAHKFLEASGAEKKCQTSFITPERLAEQFGCKFRKVASINALKEGIDKKSFLDDEKKRKAKNHIDKKLPFMRIRISGGEPIFSNKDVLQNDSELEEPLWKANVRYWLKFFEAFDKVVEKLKIDDIIHIVKKEEWKENLPFPTCLAEREARLNIRFDTNGMLFRNSEVTSAFVDGIFNLHNNGKLENLFIQIDYSIKGATPTEFYWSQNKRLPVNQQKNEASFKPENHPQYLGYKNFKDAIERCCANDPDVRNCFDIIVERGIDHAKRVLVNFKGSLDWERFSKITGIKFAPAVNCFDLNFGWRFSAKIYRYAKRGGMVKFVAGDEWVDLNKNTLEELFEFKRLHSEFEAIVYPAIPAEELKKGKSLTVKRVPKAKLPQIPIEYFVGRKGWILSGNARNWEVGLENEKWGLKPKHKTLWELVQPDDVLVFYVTSPISGAIGLGKAKERVEENFPLWPDEIEANQVIYPLRIKFETVSCLSKENWKEKRLPVRKFGLEFQHGINPIRNEKSLVGFLQYAGKILGVNWTDLLRISSAN